VNVIKSASASRILVSSGDRAVPADLPARAGVVTTFSDIAPTLPEPNIGVAPVSNDSGSCDASCDFKPRVPAPNPRLLDPSVGRQPLMRTAAHLNRHFAAGF
jgi:hypothetical protein